MDGQDAEVGAVEVSAGPVTENATVLCVVGELDVLTAPTVAAAIERHLAERADGDTRPLVVDLSGVTFLASAGLAALANAKARANQYGVELGVVASSRVVLRPLMLTGLDETLHVAPDVAGAIVRS